MAAKIGGGRGRKGGNLVQLPGTRRQTGAGGDGRPLTSVDNLSAEEKAAAAEKQRKEREEAEAIQLLSVVSRAKAQLLKVEVARAALKVEQDVFSDIARAGKTAIKITRGQLMDLIHDSNPEGRRNVAEEEQKRARWRRAMGLPVGLSDTEQELEARLPEVERNGMFWRAAGYTSGLTGQFCNAPAECVGAGFDNLFAEGHKDGAAALNKNTKLLQPKPKPEPAKPNPLGDPHSPESLKANAASEKRARESLEALGKKDEKGPEDGPGIMEPLPGDNFEATPEELAAQTARGKTAEEIAAGGEPEAVG